MKKLLSAAVLFLSALTLSSCKVNWFGSSFDVPWYFVAIPAILIILAAYLIIIKGTYVCPLCGTEFKPKWYQLSACLHINGKRFVKCPGCGKRSYCKRKK